MRHSKWKAHGLRAFALGLACAAVPAFALDDDGTLDTSLYSVTDGIIPGLFRYGIELGGGAPYYNYDAANAMLVQPNGKIAQTLASCEAMQFVICQRIEVFLVGDR